MKQRKRTCAPEKLQILWSGSGISRFNILYAYLVKCLYNTELILNRKGNALPLGAVAQCRVEYFNNRLHKKPPFLSPPASYHKSKIISSAVFPGGIIGSTFSSGEIRKSITTGACSPYAFSTTGATS